MMTVYLTTNPDNGRHKAQVHTQAGRLIAQALDLQASAANRRAIRQAHRWAADHNWGELIVKRQLAPPPPSP